MKTNTTFTAGSADCFPSPREQSTTPGYRPSSAPFISTAPPPTGAEVSAADCYSPDAEMQVLGCILLDAKVAFEYLKAAGISPSHFYDLRYQELYQLLEQMYFKGEQVNMETAYIRGKQENLALLKDGPSLLTELESRVPTVWCISTFIEDLQDQHRRRLTLDVARRLISVARDRSAPAAQLLVDAEAAFTQLRRMATRQPFTIRSASDLLKESISDADNLMGDRLLARGQSLTLLGQGGIGKSRLLLQLAACCISGRPFLELPVHVPGLKWLIFQAENSTRRVQEDILRLQRWLGQEWDAVAERLFIHTIQDPNDSFVQLDLRGVRQRLADAIDRFDPDVVCFDPLNCFGVGDLNRDGDMRETCLALTQLGTTGRTDRAVVVLHHALTGKAGAARATGYERSSFGRNSKLLQAWTRAQINLAPANAQDNSRLVVSCGKCSNGEEFKTLAARLNPETRIYEVEAGFDSEAWARQLMEGPKREPEDDLLELLTSPCERRTIIQQLQNKGYAEATAYRLVRRALSDGAVRLEGNILHATDPEER